MKTSSKLFSTSRIVAPVAAGFVLLAATGGAFAHGHGGGGNFHTMNFRTTSGMNHGDFRMARDHGNRDHGNRDMFRTGDRRQDRDSNGKQTMRKFDHDKKSGQTKVTATAPGGATTNNQTTVANASTPLPGSVGNNTIHPIVTTTAPTPLPGSIGNNTIRPIVTTTASAPSAPVVSTPVAATGDYTTGPGSITAGRIGADIGKGVATPFLVVGAVGTTAVVATYGFFKGGAPEAYGNAKSVIKGTVQFISSWF